MTSVIEMDKRTISDALEIMRYGRTLDRARTIVRTYAAGRVTYDLRAREVYSYGRHFPLFHYVPKVGREPETFIINGDRWNNGGGPSRTSNHQAITRRLIAGTGARSVIVPFSAIAGAGISLDSIRPIHVRDDKTWTENHEVPAGLDLSNLESADSMIEEDHRKTVDWRGEPCASYGVWYREYTWKGADGAKYTRTIYRQAHVWRQGGSEQWHGSSSWRYSESWDDPVSEHGYRNGSNQLKLGADGVWRYVTHHHRLGDALISAVREIVDPSRHAAPFEHEIDTARETVRLATFTDHVWREYCAGETGKHAAGPSGGCVHCGLPLFAQSTRRIRARYLSSFDVNENPPLYFLAQCPRGSGDTVETALDSLAPRAVHAAMARGRDVRRQGDVFFIQTDLTREDLAEVGASFARLTMFTRGAKPKRGEIGYHHETAGEKRARTERMLADRRREYRRILGESQAKALVNVQRKSSRSYAVWNGADGAYLTDGNRARSAWWQAGEIARGRHLSPTQRPARRETVRKILAVYGTAHSATEVARLKSGATYVRGIVRHVPDLEPGRNGRPDHRPLELGEGWYLAVRNAVPRQNRRPRRRGDAVVSA